MLEIAAESPSSSAPAQDGSHHFCRKKPPGRAPRWNYTAKQAGLEAVQSNGDASVRSPVVHRLICAICSV